MLNGVTMKINVDDYIINTLKGSYTLGKNSTNMPMGSANTYDNLATSDYTIGGSESFDLPDTDETSWFAEMNNAPSDADGALNSLDKMGNDVANDVSDATVNTASKGGENLGSSIASEVGDATVSSGTNAAANTTGTAVEEVSDAEFNAALKGNGSAPTEVIVDSTGKVMDDAASAGASQMDNVASSVMSGSAQNTLALPGPTVEATTGAASHAASGG